MTWLEAEMWGAGTIIVSVLAATVISELWAWFGNPERETTRKFVHIASGVICLSFPFLISSAWTVAIMAMLMVGYFKISDYFGLLQSVHGVERKSHGSVLYPLAILLVFVLAGDTPWIYVASVLVLGVADAFAALVGSKFGVLRYTVEEDEKSIEGSAVFFAVAVLSIVAPGYLLGTEPIAELLLSAATAAALLTGFEAISLEGADNLFVPVGAAIVLKKQATDPYDLLVDQALVMAGVFVAVMALKQLTRSWGSEPESAMKTGGAIVASMFAYGVWTLGGFDWAVPVFTVFVVFIAAWMAVALARDNRRRIAARTTYRALLAPFAILVVAHTFSLYDILYGPFLASCAAVLCFSIWNAMRGNQVSPVLRKPTRIAFLTGLIATTATITLPSLLQTDVPYGSALLMMAAGGPLTIVNALLLERQPLNPAEATWPGPSFNLTLVFAAVVLVAQHTGWVQPWHPTMWNL